MKCFTVKIDYVDYNVKTGKEKIIIKDVINELWQLYEFEMMNIHNNLNGFSDHINRWFIPKVKEIIKKENQNERKNNRK